MDSSACGTHSMRRPKAVQIYRKTGNLRAAWPRGVRRKRAREASFRHRQVNDLGGRRRLGGGMPTAPCRLYRRHRFPPEVISYAVWLYFRFPLSLRMVEEMLAARGVCVTYETVRQWGGKFGKAFADQIRRRAPARGDKWHMDEVVVSIAGERHWLWRAVDQKASFSTSWSSAEGTPRPRGGS